MPSKSESGQPIACIEISSIEKSFPLELVEIFLRINDTVWLLVDVKSIEVYFHPNEF